MDNIQVKHDAKILSEVTTASNCIISLVEFPQYWEIWKTENSNISPMATIVKMDGLNAAIKYLVYWVVKQLAVEKFYVKDLM